jgi:hypothetical protein
LKHSINYKLSDSSKIIQSLFVFSFYPWREKTVYYVTCVSKYSYSYAL